MKEFKNWREIMEWAERNGYEKMARRMNINNLRRYEICRKRSRKARNGAEHRART